MFAGRFSVGNIGQSSDKGWEYLDLGDFTFFSGLRSTKCTCIVLEAERDQNMEGKRNCFPVSSDTFGCVFLHLVNATKIG